ncbi:extracellular solute-binding protein [Paenibacillus oenotherae]|uniref:Extracellular solute-binding protein n=1 Tax=Paenibacillus oenotherae TaxID=1435645 RepID=A0ABS7DAG1_9BACL|nr:extracellular solute-binding protein [Paenibacillus oenotherae]MBW7476586.1 extracellular solute-binding protein [Paenibacillus oenotherae]
MKIKSYIGALALLLVLSLLAACGSDTNGSNNNGTGSDGKSGKETTLTFWHHYSTASPEEKTLTEQLIPQFEAANPGIKVKAVAYPWDQLHKKLQIGGSSNDLPDVARLDIIWVPEFQKQGLLVALDEKFADFDETAKGLLEGPLSTGKIGDHYYGLPLNTNTKVLFWNKAMLEGSGLSKAPETTEEFFTAIAQIKAQSGKAWGFGEPALQGWNILPWIWSNGGDVLSPAMDTAQGYLNSPATVDILTKLRAAAQAGQIAGFKPGDVPVTEGHAQGSYAMMAEGPWAFAQFESQFPDFKAGTAYFPRGSAGSIQVLGGEDLGIFSKENGEESWKFVKFLTSEAAQVSMGKVGQIPVNLKAMENSEIKNIAYFAPFLEQLKTSKARPPVAAWPQIDTVINDTMSSIFMTDRDIKSELDQAAAKIDELLKQ